MAKRKTSPKRKRVYRRPPAVKSSHAREFHSYDQWHESMPGWLQEIHTLIQHGDRVEAKKALTEETLQKHLAAIDADDTVNQFFVRCEIAMLLDAVGQTERALACYFDTLNVVNCAGVYNKIGMLYHKQGDCTKALEYFKKAEELEPNGAYIWINQAKCLMKFGRSAETLELLRKAAKADPTSREACANLIYCLNYLPETTSTEIYEASRQWAEIQAPMSLAYTDHKNVRDPNRKLRIGYISPDFRKHSVTYFFEPLLDEHNRDQFEIFGYGDVEAPDIVTKRLVGKFDNYRSIKGLGDQQAAALIRSDSIDILVDLAGHTGRNRLHVLACKPAPIQVTYLGYPNTTGMPQVDYRFTDEIADTPEQQQYYTEKHVYLPNGFLCYDPGDVHLPVKPLPMTNNGHVTFGCFNNVNKLNPPLINIWSGILNRLPKAKMILKFQGGQDPDIQSYYYDLFQKNGVDRPQERITLYGWLSNAEHYELYNKVDIALDTYPYNGTTTTCEAFLMGVPVISLAGACHASRVGLDLLTRIGMPTFAAQNEQEYIEKAAALAQDPEGLAQIRMTLRQRLMSSVLCNKERITRDIEAAFRKMWQGYCGQAPNTRLEVDQPNHGKNDQPKVSSLADFQWPEWLKKADILVRQGKLNEAVEQLDEPRLQRAFAEAGHPEKEFLKYIAAGLLRQAKQPKRAEVLYKEMLDAMPKNPAIYNDLAYLYREQGRVTEAVDLLIKATQIKPDEPKLWTNLSSYLIQLGQTDKAIPLLKKAVERVSDNYIYSNLLLGMHYLEDVDRQAIFEESKRWAQSNAPAQLATTGHDNVPDAERKLRIGYISPDFREHSVTFFFEPLLDGHHRDQVEIYGYGNVSIPDTVTERLKGKFDVYRDVKPLSDKDIADLIRKDKIDILVDLAGHTGNTRIYAMAYKPAPVQVTWLGYPDTTGMSQMDYRITDAIADPPGSQAYYTEQLHYLPDGFLCYGPGENMPPMGPLPALENGYVTFGAFNDSAKINSSVIKLWSGILHETGNSKLMLKFRAGRDDNARKRFLSQFEDLGIAPERIMITGWLNLQDHLKLYNHIDISLDTFPYNGTTTTCQSLLMGVPVISLAGEHHMSRVGLDILSRLDMAFFAPQSPDEYVKRAVALTANLSSLAKIRETMRLRMASSPLCNRDVFASSIEAAYRTMWRQWCQSQESRSGTADTTCPAAVTYTAEAKPQCTSRREGKVYMQTGKHDNDKGTSGCDAKASVNAGTAVRKLHIGGRATHPEWELLNIQPGPGVDHIGDAKDLSQFEDETFDELYGSHVVEHFDYNGPLQEAFREWYRVLKPGGRLYISVPDMDILCQLFLKRKELSLNERFHVIRMMFGGHVDPYDYHYVGLDYQMLTAFLKEAKFRDFQRVESFALFDDTSSFRFAGVPISLNVVATK